jgi:hypothetical protein
MVQVKNGKFERVHPDKGFDCDSDLYEVPNIGQGL